MNTYKNVSERIGVTKLLIEDELRSLTEDGYNPIIKTSLLSIDAQCGISSNTPFINALREASKKLSVAATTLSDIRSVLKGVEKSSTQLRIVSLPISTIRRKHIKAILENMPKNNPNFSAHRFNKYRAYLIMLFKELVELEAIEVNPVREISKQKTTTKFRRTLTLQERDKVNEHLKNKTYTFWRFLQIFFHSGGRETELMRLQGKHVDITRQRYVVLIKKGRQYREVERTIKDVALPLWKELIERCSAEDYLFSVGLEPGTKQIRTDQITRRWRTHVKKPLGIEADFYSLKHLNTDETAALLGIQDAAAQNSHTTTAITLQHYAIGEKERQHNRLKQVKNSFA